MNVVCLPKFHSQPICCCYCWAALMLNIFVNGFSVAAKSGDRGSHPAFSLCCCLQNDDIWSKNDITQQLIGPKRETSISWPKPPCQTTDGELTVSLAVFLLAFIELVCNNATLAWPTVSRCPQFLHCNRWPPLSLATKWKWETTGATVVIRRCPTTQIADICHT